MAIDSTDDLIALPHIVLVRRDGTWTVSEFDRGVEGQRAAHAYAEQTALACPDAVVLVAARYRQITGPDAMLNELLERDAKAVRRYL